MGRLPTFLVVIFLLSSFHSLVKYSHPQTEFDLRGVSSQSSNASSNQQSIGNFSQISSSFNLGFNESIAVRGYGNIELSDVVTDSGGNTYAAFVVGTQANSYVLLNGTKYYTDTNGHVIFVKFQPNLSVAWAFNATGLAPPILHLSSNESLVVGSYFSSAGEFFGNSDNSKSLFFAKVSQSGLLIQFVKKAPPTSLVMFDFAIDSFDAIYTYGTIRCASCTVQTSFGSSSFWVVGGADFFAKLNSSGTWDWATTQTGNSWQLRNAKLGIDSANNIIFSSEVAWTSSAHSFFGISGFDYDPNSGGFGCVTFKMFENRSVQWFKKISANQLGTIRCTALAIDPDDRIIIAGEFEDQFSFNSTSYNTLGGSDAFLGIYDNNGTSVWMNTFGSVSEEFLEDVSVDPNGTISLCGHTSGVLSLGSIVIQKTGIGKDLYFLQVNNDSSYGTTLLSTGGGAEQNCKITSSQGRSILGYEYTGQTQLATSSHSTLGNTDVSMMELRSDFDADGVSDYIDDDDDDDGIEDDVDRCQFGYQNWISGTNTDHDSDGCYDLSEDVDDDNDGVSDDLDDCEKGAVNWLSHNSSDLDNDGCQDIGEDVDDDNDGFIDLTDYCPTSFGNSTFPKEQGCVDTDGDSRPDLTDPFPNDWLEWRDSDNDGSGDNSDHLPFDPSQQQDTDGDSYGDNEYGTLGDSCPMISGNSTVDLFGCIDSDVDGWSDLGDSHPTNPSQFQDRDGDGYGDNQSENATQSDRFPMDGTQWADTDGDGHGDNPVGNSADRFPNDPNRWQDSDHDGVADEDDAFPDDATQDTDSDGDGYGDNAAGNRGDTFPNDPNEWDDTDGDDVGNNEDAFPFDPSQTTDADGDGFGDNPRGTGADKFPEDATQWSDIDGDGYGDNTEGTTPDAFIADPTQWSDVDGDGYGDNPTGRLADAFPNDPTQWEDMDGDGFGDNSEREQPRPVLVRL